jgi:hypothetical protein
VDLLSLLLSLCFAFGVEADATVKKAEVGGEAGATTTCNPAAIPPWCQKYKPNVIEISA